jgi:hypothetical protein
MHLQLLVHSLRSVRLVQIAGQSRFTCAAKILIKMPNQTTENAETYCKIIYADGKMGEYNFRRTN